MQNSITILSGPNLNRLGSRETDIYGTTTLDEIGQICQKVAASYGVQTLFKQSNHEGELIEMIHAACDDDAQKAIIINGGAYTHTSIGILDALKSFTGEIIEVHLSNIFSREPYRHHSFISEVASGVICGLGPYGYKTATEYLAQKLKEK